MTVEHVEPDWRTILTHEAGHAVAALALHNEAADIRLRGAAPGTAATRASYALPDIEDGFKPNPCDPVERVMVYAAGAKAEEVMLNIRESAGFGTDWRKIEGVRAACQRGADVAYLRGLGLPAEALARALADAPGAQAKLMAIESEIASNYSRTRTLIELHRAEVEAIADAAARGLRTVERIDGSVLLSADQVRSLWAGHGLTLGDLET